MMETILNLGLNDRPWKDSRRGAAIRRSRGTRYRRFVQMYAAVVFDLPKAPFEATLEEARRESAPPATSTCRCRRSSHWWRASRRT